MVSWPDHALTFAVAVVSATAGAVAVTGSPLWSHEVTLPPQDQSIAIVRRFVRDHLDLHHLPMLIEDVTLAASELATNALRHARTPFTVTISAFADDVVLAVRDGSAAMPIRVDAHIDDVAGRGMAIVEVVSRDWGVEVVGPNVGKSVWAAFEVG